MPACHLPLSCSSDRLSTASLSKIHCNCSSPNLTTAPHMNPYHESILQSLTTVTHMIPYHLPIRSLTMNQYHPCHEPTSFLTACLHHIPTLLPLMNLINIILICLTLQSLLLISSCITPTNALSFNSHHHCLLLTVLSGCHLTLPQALATHHSLLCCCLIFSIITHYSVAA